jgi:pyruvate dehydrogenase E1 component beta subunit
LNSVRKTGRAVLVHEAVRPHGVGAEIAATLHEELFGQLKAPVRRIGSNFSATPAARNLEAAFLPSQAAIADAVRSTLS